jgi:Na+/H+ antiporter NhaD/arsenite permease-like protein
MLAEDLATLRAWGARRWWAAAAGAVATVLLVGLPTVLIPNPVFGREIEVTWWAWPVLVVTAVLGGLVMATYVRDRGRVAEDETGSRRGLAGGLLAFFAVGCPVCNKLVLVLLGYAGALQWFAPVQPLLAALAVAALLWALHARLAGERACPVRSPTPELSGAGSPHA